MLLRFTPSASAALLSSAAAMAAVAFAPPARAELTLPPELSPGVPALVSDPKPAPEIEGEAGPREPVHPAKKAKPAKAKKPKPSTQPRRVSLDLARRGPRQALGLSYRVLPYLDVGYSGLFARSTGSEFYANLFANLGKVRPMISAGVPIYPWKGVYYPGFRGIGAIEWRPTRVVGFFANFTVSRFAKELAKVERTSVMPGAGLLLYL